MTAIPAIDAWCNPFDERGIRTIFIDNEEVYFMMGEQWGRTGNMKYYTPEEWVEKMDEEGVAAVCVPSLKMAFYRRRAMASDIEHEHIAQLCERAPGRVFGLAGIDPMSGMKGVRHLEQAITEYGFVGAHVHPFGFGIPINEKEWWPFYTKCAELDVPVVFQVGHSAEFMPSACGKPILLDDIAIWFPELKLVGGHTGWPWTEELISMAWKHPNVYIACSGHAPKYWDPKLVKFLNSRNRGIGKVMWGTDYPLILHNESLEQIEQLDLKPEALQALLHDTAAKVFKINVTATDGCRPARRHGTRTAERETGSMDSSGSTPDRVLVEVADGLATVTLNRPEKLNALDVETYRILSSLADELAEREDVQAVVLTGAGRAFCAGADLTTFARRDRLRRRPHGARPPALRRRVVNKWVKLDKPTIAAVNGIAIGGGCNLALMCDLVLMREDATIGQTYVQRGLVMDMGGTYFLPRLVGRARANELALLGDAISAAEAAAIGLVNRCVPVRRVGGDGRATGAGASPAARDAPSG